MLECLRGGGPADLVNLSLELAAEMVFLAGRSDSLAQARSMCEQTINDGSALERFRDLVQAQGGDPRAIDDPARLPAARRKIELKSPSTGFVQCARSSAGRARDHAAGRGPCPDGQPRSTRRSA